MLLYAGVCFNIFTQMCTEFNCRMGRYKKQSKICIDFSELTMIKMEWNKTQFELDWGGDIFDGGWDWS